MRRLITTIVAALGLIGFAAAAQADCAGHLTTASTDSTSVATTDSTTTIKPILQEQSGG